MPRRFVTIFCLMLAGEAVFALPFHVPRFFRATLLEVSGLTNAQLGDAFAVYGVMAMLSYFPGGMLADRFSARRLLVVSLLATAAGGLYLATMPGFYGMCAVFAYWGVTTILLFWAALIRSTRDWGGALAQGRAFGLLDGGRGLLAAGLASVATLLFSRFLDLDPGFGEPHGKGAALATVIVFYTVITAAAGIVVWFLVPDTESDTAAARPSVVGARALLVIRDPMIWTQALIVVCAYCAFKGLDNFALYAVQVLGMSDVEAAAFVTANAYIRPVAAVGVGLVADRFSASRLMVAMFLLLTGSFGYLSLAAPVPATLGLLLANIAVTFTAVYGLRAVYFALLEEVHVPPRLTGSAVGLISLVGFTPDIFFASIGGRLLDQSPGLQGHQHYFMLLAAIMAVGLCATALLIQLARRRKVPLPGG